MNSATIRSPLGILKIVTDGTHLQSITFTKKMLGTGKKSKFLLQVIKELDEYFQGKRVKFTVPLKASGTEFQKAVWKEMGKINHGRTKTYGALAKAIKRPKAVRAVGTACGKNPLPIIVPCHRVKGARGLGGYSGGLSKKRWLLQHEGKKRL